MPSPFPGMNPYLERPGVWGNFHGSLIYRIRDELAAALQPRYFVSVEDNVYIHEMPDEPVRRIGKPYLMITRAKSTIPISGTATLEAPARVRIFNPVEELRVPYLAITDRAGEHVVTVIEILSPSNKANGSHRDQYLAKRRAVLDSPAYLVEIDLLRGGPRLPAENFPPCDYSVMISRPAGRPEAEVWPIMLRQPLPPIPIPLLAGDAEPVVELQDLLHRIYDAAAFHMVAYRSPPEPPLSAADAAWAMELISAVAEPCP